MQIVNDLSTDCQFAYIIVIKSPFLSPSPVVKDQCASRRESRSHFLQARLLSFPVVKIVPQMVLILPFLPAPLFAPSLHKGPHTQKKSRRAAALPYHKSPRRKGSVPNYPSSLNYVVYTNIINNKIISSHISLFQFWNTFARHVVVSVPFRLCRQQHKLLGF